jgi:nucleotide-binding universal stress UspA family protein
MRSTLYFMSPADGTALTRRMLAGAPRDAIASASAEAQLLIVGTRTRGREWTRWIRSVARAVIDRATCPVAVIPQQHPRSATAD